MKNYFVEPERLKSLLESAEKHLGLSPKEAEKHVTNYLKDEAVRWAKDPKNCFLADTFANRLAPRSRGIDNESDDGKMDKGMLTAMLGGNLSAMEKRYIEVSGLGVDIEKYARFSSWTVEEAVWIFYGLDPKRGLDNPYVKAYPIYKKITDTYDIAQRAASDGIIPPKGDPMLFFDWAELMNLPIPEGIKEAVLDHAIKRDTMEAEQQTRMAELIADLEMEKREREAKENPEAPDPKSKPLFTVKMDVDVRETFYKEIRDILVTLSEAGEKRPSGAELMKIIGKNPERASCFIQIVPRRNEIEYKSDKVKQRTDKISRDNLQKTIYRLTSIEN